MKATAFLALWNGISSAALQEEYETWHTFEHVPERVSCPDFIAGERYATQAQTGVAPRYFTCYWLADLAALRTASYQALVDHPTPWSARMRQHLTSFHRLPCLLEGSYGQGRATQLTTLQMMQSSAAASAHLDEALKALVSQGLVVRAHWGRVDGSLGAHPLDTAADDNADSPGPVILLEHHRRHALDIAEQLLAATLTNKGLHTRSLGGFERHSEVRQSDLPHSPGTRPADRPDLRKRFLNGDTQ